MKVNTTQAIKLVQSPDTKTQKPSKTEIEKIFPNQMQAH